jgi:6,7-dimethyl-8-ribityllumazine synthase
VGVAQARFNEDIGEGLRSGCLAELARLGVAASTTSRITTVPGALELPLTLQAMAQSGRFDALVALGAVIRGETYHFEVVSNESARGITDVQLNTGIPIANAVLTTENDDQALVRMVQKGAEAAQAAIEMANLLKALK